MKEFRYIKRVGEQCRYVKGVFTPDKRFLKQVFALRDTQIEV